MPSRYSQSSLNNQIVFATHNRHKFTEVSKIFPSRFELKSLTDFNFNNEIEETENSLEGNALLKANYIYNHLGLPCISDDSGLFVHSLEGDPGVYSARYSGIGKSDQEHIQLLLRNLENSRDRSAYFKTVIILKTDREHFEFSGEVHGKISEELKGENGFGYDPVFIPNGYDKTFAELPLNTKNSMSHRAIAVSKLIDFLNTSAFHIL